MYVPITKWLLDFVGKPYIDKASLYLLLFPYEVWAFSGGDTFTDRSSALLL